MKHLLRKSREQKSIETFVFQRQDYLDKQSYEAPQMFSAGKAKHLMAAAPNGNQPDFSNYYQRCY